MKLVKFCRKYSLGRQVSDYTFRRHWFDSCTFENGENIASCKNHMWKLQVGVMKSCKSHMWKLREYFEQCTKLQIYSTEGSRQPDAPGPRRADEVMDKYAIHSPDLDQPGYDSNTPQNKAVSRSSVHRPKSKDNILI